MTDTSTPAIATHEVADPDAAILAAWNERREAFARYNALPHDDPRENDEWAIIDRAEVAIRGQVSKTLNGIAAQVWVGLQYSLTQRTDDAAAQIGDIAYFADDERFEMSERMALAALRSLAAQGAAL